MADYLYCLEFLMLFPLRVVLVVNMSRLDWFLVELHCHVVEDIDC